MENIARHRIAYFMIILIGLAFIAGPVVGVALLPLSPLVLTIPGAVFIILALPLVYFTEVPAYFHRQGHSPCESRKLAFFWCFALTAKCKKVRKLNPDQMKLVFSFNPWTGYDFGIKTPIGRFHEFPEAQLRSMVGEETFDAFKSSISHHDVDRKFTTIFERTFGIDPKKI